jgi:hypothetical protein
LKSYALALNGQREQPLQSILVAAVGKIAGYPTLRVTKVIAPAEAESQIFAFLEAWPGYAAIAKLFRENPEIEIYVAGGIVRDAFLSKQLDPKDVDIFVQGRRCEDVVEGLAQFGILSTGSFGAYEWLPDDENAVACDIIRIDRFFNGLWHCRDMLDALNQFDCTVNALAVNLRNRHLINPQNGLRDIESRTMRAVRFDYPDEPISESSSLTRNAVLWWRMAHYALLLNLTVEPVTLSWLRHNRAYESCRDEFEREFHAVGDVASILS